MPRKLEKALTPRKVATCGVGMHCDGGGLYLQVTEAKNGGFNRSWVFRYGLPGPNGKTRYRDHGLGPLSTFSLAQARERAKALREKRYDGIDPIEERKAARAMVPVRVVTFGEVSDQWLDAKAGEWKPTYARAQRQRLADYVLPIVGKMAVRDVAVGHVTSILDDLWASHPNSANLTRMEIEQVLDFAKIKGHRDGDNPAAWKGNLKHIYGKVGKLRVAKRKAAGKEEHHAALDYREVAAFMASLRAIDNNVTAAAFEFTILTATRTAEAVGARWEEVDLSKRLWTIPGSRMKAGKELRVPLSDAAAAVLQRMAAIRVDARVFPGLGRWSLLHFLRGRLKRTDLTTHGFRSSFRDWAAECTNFPRELAEAALAHAVGGVEGAYQRGDLLEKRRKLMYSWASYCAKPAAEGKVVPMKAKAR